jgi:hypothetical protein
MVSFGSQKKIFFPHFMVFVSVPDSGSGAFPHPRSGMIFFRIPDYEKDFSPESIRSKKKVSLQEKSKFALHFSCRIRDEKMFESGSGMRKWLDRGSGIKHPGSATLSVSFVFGLKDKKI